MLGKTNLTKVEKGAIITDIADYRWNVANTSGVTGNFVKTLYANNILVGITIDGTVAYTKDGENWEIKKIELDSGDFIELADIAYGNGKYVIVGYHRDNEDYIHGLIVITEDFSTFEIVSNWHSDAQYNFYEKIVAVTEINNTFIMCTIRANWGASSSGRCEVASYIAVVDDIGKSVISYKFGNIHGVFVNTGDSIFETMGGYSLKSAKKSDGTLICYMRYVNAAGTKKAHDVVVSKDGRSSEALIGYNLNDAETLANPTADLFNLFECKDNLYFIANVSDFKYRLSKVLGDSETFAMSEDIEYGFIGGAYFNKCEIFVNNHEMLIIRPGESIMDKTINDLVEITYDFSITSIIKAFNKLYVFGTDGNVLISNDENNNEESLAVRTMSASRALYEAKSYTDAKIEELRKEMEEIGNAQIQAIWDEVFDEGSGTT